ncbi:MAG: hypothetical protein JW940_35725 [Polyangiaceae bacterium]|nr:hypothetical protein [Polyangiaceae bacterium]
MIDFILWRAARELIGASLEHYLTARYRQGPGGRIIRPATSQSNNNATLGPSRCRLQLGGLLNFYYREAA